jgi:glycolate oxidase FAD binding subunit
VTTGTANACAPDSAAALAAFLRSRPGRVRLVGSGSRQDRLPPPGAAARVALHRLASIDQLDAGDRTCSVDCGLAREVLDAALAERGLELPCPGSGTIGGLFASDPIGAASPGGPSPRSLLLGCEAVLADGTPFRSGARVVKSVAGFDVHKLLIGSQGRLFAATRLHLRLAPRPRAAEWFEKNGLGADEAVALLRALGDRAVPPVSLQLHRGADGGFAVRGRFAGRPAFVSASLRAHGLAASPPRWIDHVARSTTGEVVAGMALIRALPGLLAVLPGGGAFVFHGGGRFEVATPSADATDALLDWMARHRLHGHVVHGAPARREVGTPIPSATARLLAGLRQALDPHGILA